MRPVPAAMRGYRLIDLACVFAAEFCGLDSLVDVPALTAGFKSGDRVMSDAARKAAETFRLLGLKTNSIGQLKSACDEREGPAGKLYEVDKASLSFRPVSGNSVAVAAVRECLGKTPPRRVSKVAYADPARPFEIELRHGVRCSIRLDDAIVEPFEIDRFPEEPSAAPAPFLVTFAELLSAAGEMDRMDVALGGPPSNWEARLVDVSTSRPKLDILARSDAATLSMADVVEISGPCHILGLPGTGKTTLVMLMAFIAARRGLRFAAFTTSVAVADELRRTISRYGVRAELVYGSSAQAKARHSGRYADLISAEHGDSGFGRTSDSAMRFATGCALEGYIPEDRFDQVQKNSPPCRSIRQRDGKVEREKLLCPLIGVCGRHEASRAAVHAEAWFGHLSILETSVPPYISVEAMTYAELLARRFDLVFIDEADAAQKSLDEKGLDRITLSGGTPSMFTAFLQEMAGSTVSGKVEWLNASDNQVVNASNHILRHLSAFQKYVKGLDGDRPHRNIVNMIDGTLLNTTSIMASLHGLVGGRTDVDRDAFFKMGAELEGALRTVYFFDEERDKQRMGVLHEDALAYNGTLVTGLVEEPLRSIADKFMRALGMAETDAEARKIVLDHVRILCHVISCVVHVETIMRTLPYMKPLGDQSADRLQASLFSREMMAQVAESVVGHLSGLKVDLERHPATNTITGLRIDYEAYRGTPRLLPDRLTRLPGETRGPHVVSLSATSFMPMSKTYHLGREPDFILSRVRTPEGDSGSGYRFVFSPVSGGHDARPLAVSGAGADRDVNLRAIVREVFNPQSGRIAAARRGVDPDRKIAIVVNSYAQVDTVMRELSQCNPGLRSKTIGITREYDGDHRTDNGFHTAQEASLLGRQQAAWECIVFPAAAFGRGVNLVFPSGHRLANRALIGTMFFPIRPHPSQDDSTFLQGKLASISQGFDDREYPRETSIEQFAHDLRMDRYRARDEIAAVNAMNGSPLAKASTDDAESFASNILVELGQVMGRAIRGGLDANMVFVDAAWCPRTAAGSFDTPASSLLLRMAKIIEDTVTGPDKVHGDLMEELYGNILSAVRAAGTIRTQADVKDDADAEYEYE